MRKKMGKCSNIFKRRWRILCYRTGMAGAVALDNGSHGRNLLMSFIPLNIRIDKRPIMVKAVAGAGLITAVEFFGGLHCKSRS